ncbi:MAG: hypothetical protein IPM93_09275 [Candidatus Obscuribacter sp.]|nr:hypothetical protein [Candidatus Obscuribacter sp.]
MAETTFVVVGHFKVATAKPPGGGRRIEKEHAELFWQAIEKEHPNLQDSSVDGVLEARIY